MNIQEYISSGIIESCVLGLGDAEERAEFERMCDAHSEVRVARDNFEKLLEIYAHEHGQKPPLHVKSRIFAEIQVERDRKGPQIPAKPVEKPVIRPVWIHYLAGASLVLLLISTGLNFYFFSQYKRSIGKYDELVSSQQRMAAVEEALQARLRKFESDLALIRDPAMAVVRMSGVPNGPRPGSLATVYWDTRSKDVYLMLNDLPVAAPDRQYQLWAIVEGNPHDAGIVDAKEGGSLVKMKNIAQAQAFAISLEKKGGSTAPTQETIYVIGKVSG